MTTKTNEQLDTKLDEILKALQSLENAEAARVEREKTQGELVKKHEQALYGNGKEGLIAQVNRLANLIADWTVKANIVAGLVGAQLVALIFGIITHTFTFTP